MMMYVRSVLKFVAQKRAEALHLLKQLEDVDSIDSQVALLLLRLCGRFCRLLHLARSTSSSLDLRSIVWWRKTVSFRENDITDII